MKKKLIAGVLLLFLSAFAVAAEAEVLRDIVYGHKDGMGLLMDVYRPDENANGAGVAYVVSASFNSTRRLQQAVEDNFTKYLDAGFTVFAVRHGSVPRYTIPDAYRDVTQAMEFIGANAQDFGVDARRVGIFGGSAGGLLALLVGLADTTLDGEDRLFRPAAVVAFFAGSRVPRDYPPARNRSPATDFDPALDAAVSPVNHVSANDPPVLLVHGDADERVPIGESELMHEALKNAGVVTEFVVIKDGPHGGFSGEGKQIADSALLAWFEKYLD